MFRSARLGLSLAVLASIVPPANAGSPRVRFDTDSVVGCVDVTPLEFAEANPGEKLVEASFLISTLIGPGDSDAELQHLYTIESRQRTMQVEDYEPKTTLAADVVGHMLIENKNEKGKSIGLNLSGSYDKYAAGTASAGIDSKNGVITKYEKLPPLEVVAASGPIRRGSGVYFKLKPSSQTSLEGAQAFVAVFRVPATWRGDYIHIHCEAWSVAKGLPSPFTSNEPVRVGGGDFFVALHLEGDVEAKAAALQFSRAELMLRSAAARYEDDIARRSYSSVAHQFGALISLSERKIPSDWLARVMYSSPAADHDPLLHQLPSEVRSATDSYLAARWRLSQMNAWGDPMATVISRSGAPDE
jgi:hypothetical protein